MTNIYMKRMNMLRRRKPLLRQPQEVKVDYEIMISTKPKRKFTCDRNTHDVRIIFSKDNNKVQNYIKSIAIMLNPLSADEEEHVYEEPPYELKTSVMDAFSVQINVYWQNEGDLGFVSYHRDITLEGAPSVIIQKESYTFERPSTEFKQKLIKGGGVLINKRNARALSKKAEAKRIDSEIKRELELRKRLLLENAELKRISRELKRELALRKSLGYLVGKC
ncbi:protein ENL-like [Planococcus citri]|uniref:protein ENL-like n=1 Tax=Planococcus citri TaxID=170843 RepID=UPI0031F92524